MKNPWKIAFVVMLAVVLFSVVYAESFYTLIVRHNLTVYGKAVVDDSLRVNGPVYAAGSAWVKQDAFLAKATRDTVVWTGTVAGDKIFITSYGTAIADTVSAMCAFPKTDTVIVTRDSLHLEASQKYSMLRFH